jgi:hypothetical protein
MVDRLIQAYNNRKNYKAMQNRKEDAAPRKQVQCSFRLMNILFSDEFADQFASLGDAATRQVLDTGMAGNDEHFWVRVREAFVTAHEDYDVLQFKDEIFVDNDIDPGKIIEHDWKKLRTIWKAVNAEYKAALVRYTISGTHTSDFYSFCNGKLDVYYLRKHLQQRPNLNGTVEADLPEECAVSSEKAFSERKTASTTTTSETEKKSSEKKRKRGESDIALAIRDFSNSHMRVELAKQKLQFMQKEDVRQEAEHQRQKQKSLFEEWEKVQLNIRLLRQDIRDTSIDATTRAELQEDIDGLVKRKNKLASELGLK